MLYAVVVVGALVGSTLGFWVASQPVGLGGGVSGRLCWHGFPGMSVLPALGVAGVVAAVVGCVAALVGG